MELHHYMSLEELVHQAIKVEQQLKRKGQLRRSSNYSFNSSSWKDKQKKEGTSSPKEAMSDPKGKNITSSRNVSTNKIVKCFKCQGQGHIASQCPIKRTVLIEENDDLEDEEGVVNDEGGEEEEDGENGEFLMTRRMLGNQAKEEESNQRENLFHTRCSVQGNVCSLIIDGGKKFPWFSKFL